jgi:SAM-dependent methyltransferase
VQFGSGPDAVDGWLNFDSSPSVVLSRIPILRNYLLHGRPRFASAVRHGDVVRGLPLPDESVAGLYASHVLEHLSRHDADRALAEAHRLLVSDGIFRVVVPDLEFEAQRYLGRIGSMSAEAAPEFMRRTLLGVEKRDRSWRALAAAAFGNSRHLWMWDFSSLAQHLQEAGFRNVRRAYFHDSADPAFALVERGDRFHESLAVEARK